MGLRGLVRPAARLVTGAATIPRITTRGHKTAARTKRALKLAPHDSFLPDRSAAFPAADSIIYNPPASEASPEHTPFLFLPSNDPRRLALQQMRENPGAPRQAASVDDGQMPPAMRYPRREPRYNLKQEDFVEMRRLRAEDPIKWSVGHLAQKFNCSRIFASMAAPAPQGHRDWLSAKLERKMARWGPIKTQAREERRQRAEMLYRGEL